MFWKIIYTALLTACLSIAAAGCGIQEKSGPVPAAPGQEQAASPETQPPRPEQSAPTLPAVPEAPPPPQPENPGESAPVTKPSPPQKQPAAAPRQHVREVYVPFMENHPLHRSGELSRDELYYAYEESSSLILVRMPAAEEYTADNSSIPRVLYTDGRRKAQTFAEIEEEYARRLGEPRLTLDELTNARISLRSVYDWNFYFYQCFSADSHYLAYLHQSSFGRNRSVKVVVVDLADGFILQELPLARSGEYAEIAWLDDNETLEIYLPHAGVVESGSLSLRRQWHLPSGRMEEAWTDVASGLPLDAAEAAAAIAAYTGLQEEQNRTAEELARLSAEERVARLAPEELAAEYEQYFTLYAYQAQELQERGYSPDQIAAMDSADYTEESYGWLLSPESIRDMKYLYPDLQREDLSQWTYQDAEEYSALMTRAQNAPPEHIRREMQERQLPFDLDWSIAKEFYGWENMLAYTNEAIMALYESWQETSSLFWAEDAYRQAVRSAYRSQAAFS